MTYFALRPNTIVTFASPDVTVHAKLIFFYLLRPLCVSISCILHANVFVEFAILFWFFGALPLVWLHLLGTCRFSVTVPRYLPYVCFCTFSTESYFLFQATFRFFHFSLRFRSTVFAFLSFFIFVSLTLSPLPLSSLPCWCHLSIHPSFFLSLWSPYFSEFAGCSSAFVDCV